MEPPSSSTFKSILCRGEHMLNEVAHQSFFIDGKTAASIAQAEMSLIRAEDKLRNSAYRTSLEELVAYLEAAAFIDKGDLNALFTSRFNLDYAIDGVNEQQNSSSDQEGIYQAMRYINSIHWISQHISPTQKITPEILLDLHSHCLYEKGHHQSNVRFRKKAVSRRRGSTFVTPAEASKPNSKSPAEQENAFPLVMDLCEFMNKNFQSPLTQAAIAYYQYARISPFDNTETCTVKAMSHAVLFRRGLLRKTIVPLSLLGSMNPRTIDVRRFLLKNEPDDEAGEFHNLNAWIGLYAASTELAADAVSSLCDVVETLETRWQKQVGKFSRGSFLEESLTMLPSNPIFTTEIVMQKSGKSFSTVNDALARLEEKGVVTVSPLPHHRTRIFRVPEALAAYEDFTSKVLPQFLMTAAFRTQVYN